MTRSRTTARKAGTDFETLIVEGLAATVSDVIERRAKNGRQDRGDISGVRTFEGGRVVIECKNTTRTDLAGWVKEAEVERINDAAVAGVVIHKRTGTRDPDMQYVTMTVRDFRALLVGYRDAPAPPEPAPDDPVPIDFDNL